MASDGDTIQTAAPVLRMPRAPAPPPSIEAEFGSVVDVPYTMWLASVSTSLMAAVCLVCGMGLYILDNSLTLSGSYPIFGPGSYMRLFELSFIFACIAGVVHFLRRRLEAQRDAAVVVPLPFRITVEMVAEDFRSRFECSTKVSVALDSNESVAALMDRPDVLKRVLEVAFLAAVSDPVARFSKQKMEQMLKVGAVEVLGTGVVYVEMQDVRQRRLPAQPPEEAGLQAT